jgi:O-antigen/teichoic acid export membrane protein
LGLSVFLARTLGPEGNGLYALAILLPTLLTSFLNLGIAPANVYFISRNEISLKDAFYLNLLLSGMISLLGLFSGILIIFFLGDYLFPKVPNLLLWVSLIVFPVSLIQSFSLSLLQGIQDFDRFNKILIITPIINFIFILVIIWLLKLNVLGAVIGYGLSQISSLFLTIYFLRPYLADKDSVMALKEQTKKSLSYGWKAHLSNILAFLNYRLDIFLVNFFLDPVATGIYVIAVQIAERLWIFSGAVSTVLLPRLSELHEDEIKRRALTPIIARWVLLVTFLFSIFIAFTSEFFIKILFGEEYFKASLVLLLLLPGIVCGSFSRILANDLAARGKPELNMYTALIIVTVNAIANIILIPRLGINGAAVATTLSYSSNTMTKLYLYSKCSQNKWWKPIVIGREDFALIKRVLQR